MHVFPGDFIAAQNDDGGVSMLHRSYDFQSDTCMQITYLNPHNSYLIAGSESSHNMDPYHMHLFGENTFVFGATGDEAWHLGESSY